MRRWPTRVRHGAFSRRWTMRLPTTNPSTGRLPRSSVKRLSTRPQRGLSAFGQEGACRVFPMSLLLDAGALIALERDDSTTWHLVDVERRAGRPPLTHGGVVAQVWRGGTGRQSRLAAALRSTRVAPLDNVLGRAAGVLLARSGLNDAVDAALVALCRPGDQILTSDPDDLAAIADAAWVEIDIIPV